MNGERLNALAVEAHLTLALMHAQGVIYHLTDREHRSVKYALVHGAAAIFSAVSCARHLREQNGADPLEDYYKEAGA